jgi:hypothetical protein
MTVRRSFWDRRECCREINRSLNGRTPSYDPLALPLARFLAIAFLVEVFSPSD